MHTRSGFFNYSNNQTFQRCLIHYENLKAYFLTTASTPKNANGMNLLSLHIQKFCGHQLKFSACWKKKTGVKRGAREVREVKSILSMLRSVSTILGHSRQREESWSLIAVVQEVLPNPVTVPYTQRREKWSVKYICAAKDAALPKP